MSTIANSRTQGRPQSGCSRRGFIALMACACAAPTASILTGCGSTAQADAQRAITEGIDKDMASLAAIDSGTAADLFPSDFTDQLVAAGVDPATVYAPLFSSMTWEVEGVDVASGNTQATARVTITNKDLTAALENYTATLTEDLMAESESLNAEGQAGIAVSSGGAAADRSAYLVRMAQLLAAALGDTSLGMVTTSASVEYALVDGAWIAQDTTDLRRALLGGMDPDSLLAALSN